MSLDSALCGMALQSRSVMYWLTIQPPRGLSAGCQPQLSVLDSTAVWCAEFFRPLAKPSAPIYVDCADRLVLEAGEAGRLTQKETVEIIREVLALHPLSLLAEDEGAALRDSRMRAGQFFNRLIASGWLEDQTLGPA